MKKYPFPSIKPLLLASVSTACLCLPAQAGVIINFLPDTVNPTIGTQLFTTSNPLVAGTTSGFATSNVIASGVTPPALATDLPRLVGGASFTAAAATTPSLRTASSNTLWRWQTQTAPETGQAWELRNLLMVQQADWNALTTGTVGFDSTSSMTIDLDDNGGGATTNSAFVVLNGGNYYISQKTAGKSQTTLAFSSATDWAAFAPTGFPTMDFTSLTYSSQTASFFDDVTAVGFYWQVNAPSGATNPRLGLEQFTVDATVIPEPSTVALLGAGLAGALISCRRNRR